MAENQNKPGGNGPGPQNWVPQNLWFWWLALTALLIWNAIALWPRSTPEVDVPYSTFLEQIRADNVSKVHIIGDGITGAFAKPLLWPPKEAVAKPAQESRPSPEASASPAPKAAGLQPAAAASYSEFHTTFPAAVGDPQLLPLL